MSELDSGYPPKNGGGPDPMETGPVPFFPGAPSPAPGAPQGIPLSAPVAAPAPAPAGQPPAGRHSQATGEHPLSAAIPAQGPPLADERAVPPPGEPPPATGSTPVVKGRIKVQDEVVEKIAALAALEVRGIASLGGDTERAIESVRNRIGVGQRRGDQGVTAKIQDNEISLDVTVVVEYGSIVMEVAKAVKSNVARVTSRMLGMRVTSVNITVDDVHIPGENDLRGPAGPPAESLA
ncbi:MAG: hypothetical protein JWO67_7363 [Streptosporangiaceae bacterium]|jgi:uncharacterized alkaline shock family protein YloU|nr:hypothetical protein [Streptosporangiaceae bacterium]